MQPLSKNQMVWLARGAALGGFLQQLLRSLHAIATDGYIGLTGGRLSKRS